MNFLLQIKYQIPSSENIWQLLKKDLQTSVKNFRQSLSQKGVSRNDGGYSKKIHKIPPKTIVNVIVCL